MTKHTPEDVATELTKALANKGLLIEAGFAAFAHFVVPNATVKQIIELRYAFMCGADHLYSSIMNIMDPGSEPTDADLRRMELIDKEIRAWREQVTKDAGPSEH